MERQGGITDARERRRWRVACAAALLVHAALFASLSRRPALHALSRVPSVTSSADVEIDLAPRPPTPPPSAPPVSSPQTPDRARGSTPEGARAVPPLADHRELPELAGAEPASTPTLPPSPVPGSPPAELRSTPTAPRAPGMSLEQLGVGAKNPFLDARGAPDRDAPREISRRVERVLADGIAKADQRRGLGPEGPLLANIEQEARSSTAPPNSTALFRFSTDGTGSLVGVQVIDANSDHTVWQKLGDRVLARLAKKRLRGSHGANGLTFEIRVISRVALPSGRDPGLELDLFNIPLKTAKGKNPTRIRVLDVLPTYSLQDVTLPDGRIVQVPIIMQSILGVDGDPVDIGARAQRIVHARLERLWAN